MTISNEEAKRLQNQLARAPKVWRDGQYIEEQHLTSKGLPVADVPTLATLEEWTFFEGSESSGLQVRWHDGTKQYRAVVCIQDERYTGEKGPAYSKEYNACDEADPAPVGAYDFINPGAEAARRQIDAAVARRLMDTDTHAAPSDMRARLKELENDLMYPYNQWIRQQEQARLRKAASDQAVAFLQQIDVELLSTEQRAGLAALFALKGKK